MAPKFRIERLPSGVRYTPKTNVVHVTKEKGQSSRPPQVYIFGEPVGTPLHGVDDGITRSTQGLKQELGDLGATKPTYDASNFSAANGNAFAMYASIPYQRGRAPQSPFDGHALAPVESSSDYWSGRSSRSTSRLPQPSESPVQEQTSDECLPLLKVSAAVTVDGSITRTILLQRFTNTSEEAIDEARYSFPLYDGAVVVGFTCAIGDDRELIGKVKAKDEARKDYKKAVDKQETAALLEEHTPEIFETIIGNIPAGTNVSVQLEYVQEIKASILEDGEEVFEVIIPMSIAPRYGDIDGILGDRGAGVEADGLDVTVKVIDSRRVQKLHSNHYMDIQENVPVESTKVFSFSDLGKGKEHSTETSLTQIIATYTSDSAIMDEDFIVSIEAHPAHPIRSRVVLSPPDKDGLAALMLNLKPAEIFKGTAFAEEFKGEVIFVLDRSGSMDDSVPSFYGSTQKSGRLKTTKMSTLRKAMSLSIASLPQSCRFNIVSFGDDTEFLWRQSKPYTQTNLDYARTYAKALKANLGGTELSYALEKVVDSRRVEETSTQIILITDGEVEPENVLELVWKTRQKLGDSIRFFALGIGYNVPHRLINRIGEFGGGYGEVVDIGETPNWANKLIRMLSAGIMPKTWTCEIDLGQGFERRNLLSQPFGHSSPQQQEYDSPSLVPFIQAPCPIPPLHPFSFRSIFLLLDLRVGMAPTHLVLRASMDQAKTKLEHTFTVENSATNSLDIQCLAVKRALVDMETGNGRLDIVRSQGDCAKKNAVRLGTKYQVSSPWTSFIAVEESTATINEVDFYQVDFVQGDFKDFVFSPDKSESASPTSHRSSQSDLGIGDGLPSSPDPLQQRLFCKPMITSPCQPSNLNTYLDFFQSPDVSPRISSYMSRDEDLRNDIFSSLPRAAPADPPSPSMEEQQQQVPTTESGRASLKSSSPSSPRSSLSGAPSDDNDEDGSPWSRIAATSSNRIFTENSCFAPPPFAPPQHYIQRLTEVRFGGIIDNDSDSISNSEVESEQFDSTDELDENELFGNAGSRRYITLQMVAEAQDAGGLLKLQEVTREKLDGHFHGQARKVVNQHLSSLSSQLYGVPVEQHHALVDTIMVIDYVRSHLALERDLWDMIIHKAEAAVLEALGMSDASDLVEVESILQLAAMHEHLDGSVSDDLCQGHCPFLPSGTSVCVFCHHAARSDGSDDDERLTRRSLQCPEDGCDFAAEGRHAVGQLWDHMVNEGHLCR